MSGFKDFSDGSYLTGDEVDGYLMRQSVMRFASAAVRDSNLVAGILAEGMLAYLEDTNILYIYNGTAWVSFLGSQPGSIFSTTYSGTTDASGLLTVTHGAGFTPAGGWAVTSNPTSSFALFWGMDTIGATTLRLRFMNASVAGPLVSAAVVGRLHLVHP